MARAKKKESTPIVTTTATRCPKCGSTERTGYTHTREFQHTTIGPDGHRYTHVVWRYCRCLKCKQLRTDRTLENRGLE